MDLTKYLGVNSCSLVNILLEKYHLNNQAFSDTTDMNGLRTNETLLYQKRVGKDI